MDGSHVNAHERSKMPLDLSAAEAVVDPKEAAEYAGLSYVNDETPGVRRARSGKGFRYVNPDGPKLKTPPS